VAVVRHDAWDVNKAAKPAILQWMRNKSEMPEQILSNIYDAAVKSSNPDLIIAVCLVESSFNPNAKSSKGAMGLMGIVPKVWLDELKKQGIVKERRDLYMIPHNIASGAYVLGKYLSTTNNLEKALLQYVGGDPYYPGKVMQALGEIYLARTDRTG
jgi:soluble lytic murein transglycosylase-like protein